MRFVALGLLVFLSSLAASAVSRAQSTPLTPESLAQRRRLIEQSQSAHGAGDHARALDLAMRAGEIQMTPSLRQLIATEQRAIGHYVAALDSATLCVNEATNDTTIPLRAALIERCRALEADARSHTATIVVQPVESETPGLRIAANGREIPHALWSLAFVVDPGNVTVTAAAPGYAEFRREVSAAAGQSIDVPIELARENASTNATVVTLHESHAAIGGAQHGGQGGERVPPSNGIGAGPIVVLALSGTALLAGGVFVGLRQWSIDGCTWQGDSGACNNEGQVQNANAWFHVFDPAMYVAFASGAVMAVGGIVWLLVDRRAPSRRENSTHVAVSASASGVTLGITGRL
jgi:hypothetical protein